MTTEDIRNAVISAAHDAGDELNRLAGNLAAAEASLAAQRSTIADLSDYLADALARIAELEGPQPARVLLGMATEAARWDERVALTGPVAARRVFQPTWSISGLIAKVKECLADGLVPVASIKPIPSGGTVADWAGVARGDWDSRFTELGKALAALDVPLYFSIHHEPRGGGVDTPAELVPWARCLARALPIVKREAPKVLVGTIDNGHPWGEKWGTLTDAQLAVYYIPDLLAAVDFLGGDFYDGATATNPGEPAHVKMRNFTAWAKRVGHDGPLLAGEWNYITGDDCRDTWPVLNAGRWAVAFLFNSDDNNRSDLPASIGGTWSLKPDTDRLAAFRELLALAAH